MSAGLPNICPISSHFTHIPYVTDALPGVALVVIPKVGGFAYVPSPCRPLKRLSQGTSGSFHCPNPHWFLQSEVMSLYLPGTETLSCVVWPGARITRSQSIPPCFYPPPLNVGLPFHQCPAASLYHAMSFPSQLCNSVPPVHLDECGFFESLVFRLPHRTIFWHFWAFFVLRLVVIFYEVV